MEPNLPPETPKNQRLYTVSQAGKLLGVSASTLRRWERDGLISPEFRTEGGDRRYSLAQIEAFIRKQQDRRSQVYQEVKEKAFVAAKQEAIPTTRIGRVLLATGIGLTLVALTTLGYLIQNKWLQEQIIFSIPSEEQVSGEEDYGYDGYGDEEGYGDDYDGVLGTTPTPRSSEGAKWGTNLLGDRSISANEKGDLYPTTSGKGNVGTPAQRWKEIWADGMKVDKDGNLAVLSSLKVGSGEGTGLNSLLGDLVIDSQDKIDIKQAIYNSTGNNNGNVYIADSFEAAENVTLGSNTSHTITFNGLVNTSILPASDDTYDLGASANEWRNIYVDGVAYIDTLQSDSLSIGGTVLLDDGTAAAPSLAFTNDTDSGLYRLGANSIALVTGGTATQGLTVDSSGQVGVGTISPSYTFDVAGNINFTGTLYEDGSPFVTGQWSDAGAYIYANNATSVVVTDTGRMGIGDTTPSYTLDVTGDINFSGTLYEGGSPFVTGQWESGTYGVYEDDSPVIVGADADFTYLTEGVGDLRIADDLEVIDDAYIGNDLYVGAATSSTETLANAGFSLGGDDLFVAGMAGIEGNVYTDGSFIAGSTTTYGDGSVTGSAALSVSSGGSGALTLDSDSGTLTLGAGTNTIINTDAATALTLSATGDVQIASDSEGEDYLTVSSDGTNLTLGTTDAANLTIDTAGTLIISDATDLNNTLDLDVSSATAFTVGDGTNNYLTLDTTTDAGDTLFTLTDASQTLSTGKLIDLIGDTITTGSGIAMSLDSLTTGDALYIESTSTALTSGSLIDLYWNPGSATTATGDLLKLNIGANATLTGNLLALYDNGSDVFKVSTAQIESAVPHAFSAAGDTSMAYDLIFSNQTAAQIESYGPLTIVAGEAFENNNLTLNTYGSGDIVLTPGGTSGGNLLMTDTDPSIVFDVTTATDTDFWLGVQDEAGGDDDDTFQIGDGTTPGTNPFLTINTSGSVGIGDTSPDALLDLDSSATTGIIAGILSTTLTTGEIMDITATYAPTDGSTNEGLDINLTHTPTTSADNFSSINLTTTDGTALANTIYNQNNTLTLTGNAAKTGIGLYSTLSTSSTTADTLIGADLATTTTGIITAGTRNIYGLRSQPNSTAASTGGTTNVYGGYYKADGTAGVGGTINAYGLYVANGTMDTTGTSSNIGLYVESPTGADTNYAAIFAGGNVGIGTTGPGALLEVEVADATGAQPGLLVDYDDVTNNNYPLEINNAGTGHSIYDDSTAHLTAAGIWTDNSSREVKENFTDLDLDLILGKIGELPITEWNFKEEDDSIRHLGPVAEDFYSIFGIGEDNKHIAAMDTAGLALAGVKGLNLRFEGLGLAEYRHSESEVTSDEESPTGIDSGGDPSVASLPQDDEGVDDSQSLLALTERVDLLEQGLFDWIEALEASASASEASPSATLADSSTSSDPEETLRDRDLQTIPERGNSGSDPGSYFFEEDIKFDKDLILYNDLNVLGKTVVSDLGVTGTITSGLLVIDGLSSDPEGTLRSSDPGSKSADDPGSFSAAASIYTLSGPLKLQELALGNLEIMGGKLVIDTKGNLKVEGEITAKKYNVDTSEAESASVGRATIPAGETWIIVETTALTEDSLIFVTPERPVLVGSRRIDESQFEITLKEPLSKELEVSWWIVN